MKLQDAIIYWNVVTKSIAVKPKSVRVSQEDYQMCDGACCREVMEMKTLAGRREWISNFVLRIIIQYDINKHCILNQLTKIDEFNGCFADTFLRSQYWA